MVIDLLIVGITLAAAYWGYREGLSTLGLALLGFGIGALIGSRVAPLILDGGLEDPFAPVLALPAGLLIGALLASTFERFGYRLRLRFRRRGVLDVAGGTVLAAALGLVAVWIAGSLAARVDSLKEPLRDSVVIEELNAVVPPPGPLLHRSRERTDPLPRLTGPSPNIGPADPAIADRPSIKAARGSVVKLFVEGCQKGAGSGWVARDGVVVTNAHVVQGAEKIEARRGGKGSKQGAQAIWFDEDTDIAILRTAAAEGVRPLPITRAARPGTFAATLGFPGAGPYSVGPARVGDTARIPDLRLQGEAIPGPVTTLRADIAGPGSSGGPVVDARGRVISMIFAVKRGGALAYGVPIGSIRRALRRAGPPVDTGDCN